MNAQLAIMLRAAPNRLSFNSIPLTEEIIAAGIAPARRTAVFFAGMRHGNKIRPVAIMPVQCRLYRAPDFSERFLIVHVRGGQGGRVGRPGTVDPAAVFTRFWRALPTPARWIAYR